MGRENLEKFFSLLAGSREHQDKVRGFGGDIDALAAYARELGCDVSAEEVREYRESSLKLLKGRLVKPQKPQAPLSRGVQEFYALIKLAETDEEIAKRLEELSTGTPEELIAYGVEKGFVFDRQDIQAVGKDILEPSDELSDEELELVAGGTSVGAAVVLLVCFSIVGFLFIAAGLMAVFAAIDSALSS